MATKHLGLNRSTFSYYRKGPGMISNSELEVRFKACRKLMPGLNPFYQLVIDGKLVGRPTPMLSGCSDIRQKIKLQFDTGMISLFLFVSNDGNLGELRTVKYPVREEHDKTGFVTITIAEPPSLNEKLIQYVKDFQIYSQNVKIHKPDLFLLAR